MPSGFVRPEPMSVIKVARDIEEINGNLYPTLYADTGSAKRPYLSQPQVLDRAGYFYGFFTLPEEVADASFIAPDMMPVHQEIATVNAPVWGSARFRNVEFDLYLTKNLVDALPNFNIFEVIQIQDAIFDAVQ